MAFDPKIEDKLNRIGLDFLLQEVDLALTFLKVASTTGNATTRRRDLQTVQKTFETIEALKTRVKLSPEDQDKLRAKLQKLKAELQALGF